MLVEKELGLKAFEYLNDQLSQGGAYASYLFELSLNNGEIHAFLPSGIPLEQFDDPSGSIQMKTGLSILGKAEKAVNNIVKRHLRSGTRGLFLAAAFGKPDDYARSSQELPYVTHQSEVYFLLDRRSSKMKIINQVFGSARAYPSIFGLANLPKQGPRIIAGSQLTTKTVEMIAHHTHTIVLGAYDEDSYIVWRGNPENAVK